MVTGIEMDQRREFDKLSPVCVIGLWHLGAVTSVCLAEVGFSVVGVEADPQRIQTLNQGKPPLFEPGLEEMLQKNLKRGRLQYTTDLVDALRGAPFILVTYDTPVNDRDEVDLTQIFATTEILAEHLEPRATVIVNSQVPVGTCEQMRSILRSRRAERAFGLAYVPENLRLGRALDRFLRPAMIVIGADEAATLEAVEKFYSWSPVPKLRMELRSAEMTKHALNAYLATCVSFINELGNLCDEVGADATKVAAALRLDERVSSHAPLKPGGLGFSGGTLARDLRALQSLGSRLNYPTHLVNAVLAVNEEQKRIVVRRLRQIYGSLQGVTVGILGLTYKPGTSTVRRSVALEIIAGLVAEGARVKAYDPRAALEELGADRKFDVCSQPSKVAENADALIIVTEWPEFKEIDYAHLMPLMKRPVLIDTKNLLDASQLRRLGFFYWGIACGAPGQAESLAQTKGT